MTPPLNCVQGDTAFIKPTVPANRLHDRIVYVLEFMGDRKCPCCDDMLRNVWIVELAGEPLRRKTPFGEVAAKHLAIEDTHLRPIRGEKDPEAVPTPGPKTEVTA